MNNSVRQEIIDVWGAIRVTSIVFVQIAFWGAVAGAVVAFSWLGQFSVLFPAGGSVAALLLSSAFLMKVWSVHATGIVIDRENGTLTFPAADVETHLMDILTFKSFFSLARSETIKLASVRDITNDTKRSAGVKRTHQDRYGLNVMGSFGSRQIAFSSKQKRDEFRSALAYYTRRNGNFIGRDNNIDFPSNE